MTDGGASVAVQIISTIALLYCTVQNAVAAVWQRAIVAASGIADICISLAVVTLLRLRLHGAVATVRQCNPRACIVAVIIIDAITVIALLAQSGLHDAVPAEGSLSAIVTDAVLLLVLAERCTAVRISDIAVIAFLTLLYSAVSARPV